MMKKKILCIGIVGMFLLTSLASFSTLGANLSLQDNVRWDKFYGDGYSNENVNVAIETEDNGAIIVMTKVSNTNELSNVYIIRIDSDGEIIWEKTIDNKDGGSFKSIIKTYDGGYAMVGSIKINELNQGKDVWLLKINGEGEVQFNMTIHESGDDKAYSLQETLDGRFFITAKVNYGEAPNYTGEAVLFTVSRNGVKTGCKYLNDFANGIHFEGFSDIIIDYGSQGDRDGYILTGSASPLQTTRTRIKLVKINEDGSIRWDKILFEESLFENRPVYLEDADKIIKTQDGGYLLAGDYTFPDAEGRVFLAKLNENYEEEWLKEFAREDIYNGDRGVNGSVFYMSMVETNDGGCLMLGNVVIYKTTDDINIFILKIDENGEIEYKKLYPMIYNDDSAGVLVKTKESSFYAICMTYWEIEKYSIDLPDWHKDAWVIKIDENGEFNSPPEKPEKPSGPTDIKTGEKYEYTFSGLDTDGDIMFYKLDWGWGSDRIYDYHDVEWIGPINSNDEIKRELLWKEEYDWTNSFEIRVKFMDWHGYESEWSDSLNVGITSKEKSVSQPRFSFLQHFMNQFPLLAQILQLLRL